MSTDRDSAQEKSPRSSCDWTHLAYMSSALTSSSSRSTRDGLDETDGEALRLRSAPLNRSTFTFLTFRSVPGYTRRTSHPRMSTLSIACESRNLTSCSCVQKSLRFRRGQVI